EANHHSTGRQGYSLLSLADAQRPRGGWPTGLEPAPAGITTPGASVYTTATTKAGTTGLEPAAARLTSERSCSSELRPRSSAGGIRTHGLELMRLARTAAPLPRVAFEVWLAVPPAGLEPAASGLRARRH